MKREEPRRPPGYENGDPFIRRCPVCKRATMARGLPDPEKVKLARTFANAHYRHFRDVQPDEPFHRCPGCGLMLLFDDRCPEHVYERRVPWTPERIEALRVLRRPLLERGAVPVVLMGRPEHAYVYELAAKWRDRGSLEFVEDVA